MKEHEVIVAAELIPPRMIVDKIVWESVEAKDPINVLIVADEAMRDALDPHRCERDLMFDDGNIIFKVQVDGIYNGCYLFIHGNKGIEAVLNHNRVNPRRITWATSNPLKPTETGK